MTTEDREQRLREQPLGDVVKQATQDATTLVQQEIALAKAEVREKATQAGAGAGLLGGAAVAALAALGALTAWMVIILEGPVGASWAAIIVTGIWLVVAALLAAAGRSRIKRATPPAPTQTVESVKEDVQWMKAQSSSART